MLHETVLATYHGLPAWAQTALQVLLTVLVGYIVLAIARRFLISAMRRSKHIDATLTSFTSKVITSGGWIGLVIVAAGVGGVDVAALAGGLAVGGFIIGFALKDTLGNLAAGVMLLFYRPFNIGDTVTIKGHDGQVRSLGMSLTTIVVGDGRIVTVPNGAVLGDSIVNHTREERRRADVSVGIAYGADIDVAVKAILDALKQDPRVLEEPAPSIRIQNLGDNAVGLQVRPWVRTTDFWQAKADFHKTVKLALDDVGVGIPYPQMDVHMVNA